MGGRVMTVTDFRWMDETSRSGARDFEFMGSVRRVTGALWLPEGADRSTPFVLLGHGASGDRYQAPIPHLARRLADEAGAGSLAIDGPVHGLRQVGPGGREAFQVEMSRDRFQDDMVADWLAALEAVRAEANVARSALGYFGLSMGSILGIPLLASEIDFVASVIGLCGTTGAGRSARERLLADAAKIAHPVCFIMQLEDELFPRDGYLALFDALASDDKRMHANPGLHPEVPAEEVGFAFEFLAARLHGEVERRVINPLAE